MRDLIYRDKAISVINRCKHRLQNGSTYEIIIDMMKAIPSADVPTTMTGVIDAIHEAEYRGYMKAVEERPQGEWILECDGENECDDLYRCPFCGAKYGCAKYDKPNFCNECGADMRERKDFQVIVNGNCTKCGKPLSGNRIFICEECEEQSKEQTMIDLIRREDVIEAIFSKPAWHGSDGSWYHSDDIRDAIGSTQSADRPQGKWIYCEDDEGQDGYRCSECGFFVPWYYDYEDSNYILDYKACPHCLAERKGVSDD